MVEKIGVYVGIEVKMEKEIRTQKYSGRYVRYMSSFPLFSDNMFAR